MAGTSQFLQHGESLSIEIEGLQVSIRRPNHPDKLRETIYTRFRDKGRQRKGRE